MAYYVYIMTNRRNGTLYVGVTNDLVRRAYQHHTGQTRGFTSRYNLTRLVFFEIHDTARVAIQREKNIKHWPRAWKVALIERDNPDWRDLFDTVTQGRDARVERSALAINDAGNAGGPAHDR